MAAPIAAWLSGNQTWLLAVPFAILWIASPAIARWVSLPSVEGAKLAPTAADARALRLIARRTWRFFETFVRREDHMLPPDNFQEDPAPVVAHRTSPTNIGLYLLSTASAHDFGWLGSPTRSSVWRRRLSTMDASPAFADISTTGTTRATCARSIRNMSRPSTAAIWPDTSSRSPTPARSGVTSTRARQTFEGNRRRSRHHGRGNRTPFGTAAAPRPSPGASSMTPSRCCGGRCTSRLAPPEEIADRLAGLATSADTLVDITQAFALERADDASSDMLFWAQAIRNSIASHLRDLDAPAVPRRACRYALTAIGETARDMAWRWTSISCSTPTHVALHRIPRPGGSADESCYDLLASEARLASYVAIAKGDLPARHWFRLGHDVTPVDGSAALISWSGRCSNI